MCWKFGIPQVQYLSSILSAPLSGSTLVNTLGSDDHREHVKKMQSIRLRASHLMKIDEWDQRSEKGSGLQLPAATVTTAGVDPAGVRAEGMQQEPPPDENKLSFPKSRLQPQLKPPGSSKPTMNLDDIKRRLDRLKGST